MRQIFIIILLSLFGFSLKTKGQVELSQGFQQLEGYPYIICVDDVKNGDIELSDAQFDQLAIGVQFKVNRTEIDRQSDFFRLYNDSLLPLLKREDKPVLTGSPELSRDNLSQQLSKLSVQDTVLVYDNSAQDVISRKPRRELLSVKTNLLYAFAYMPGGYDKFCPIPNVAIEYYPMRGHFTFGASFDCPWWQDYDGHKYFQVRNYQLETRYYFRSGSIAKNPPGEGAAYRGLYLQAYGHAGLYGIMLSEKKGWVGEGAGAGLGIGYVLSLTKQGHWRLEFGAQFGYFLTKYDPFQWECPVDPTEHDGLYYYKWTLDAALFKERQYRFTWLGPTRVGLTLSYDLIYRKGK